MHQARLVIVTDLDGTLLDHDDYGYDPARDTLQRVHQCRIPLVINSSKTRAELDALGLTADAPAPYLVENGSALFLPRGVLPHADGGRPLADGERCWLLGATRRRVLDRLSALRPAFRFQGFNDWSLSELMARTGLPEAAARRAQARDFSEPILWQDDRSRLAEFTRCLQAQGLRLLRGGRFLHVLGNTDKGRGLPLLRRWYAKADGRAPLLVCLGDSDNDIDMLGEANIAIRIRARRRDLPRVNDHGRLLTSDATGPRGWAQMVSSILDEFDYPSLLPAEA